MTRQTIFTWVKHQYNTTPDYPWADNNAVLRHRDNNKWYGLIMEIGRDKLGLLEPGTVEVINVKCDPELIGSLRTRKGFHPAYHMNKEKWLTIRLDESVPEEEILNLIALSFQLTETPRKKMK